MSQSVIPEHVCKVLCTEALDLMSIAMLTLLFTLWCTLCGDPAFLVCLVSCCVKLIDGRHGTQILLCADLGLGKQVGCR